MVVDVAHASPATLRMVVENATQPVVASHTGLRGACDNPRNLSDEQARGIAATGGVIGIGFWREAVCDVSVDAIVKAIRYAVGWSGIDHVALGSNFDGGSPTPMDAAGLAHLTHGLTAAGFSDDDIAKLSGGNALRVLRRSCRPDVVAPGIAPSAAGPMPAARFAVSSVHRPRQPRSVTITGYAFVNRRGAHRASKAESSPATPQHEAIDQPDGIAKSSEQQTRKQRNSAISDSIRQSCAP